MRCQSVFSSRSSSTSPTTALHIHRNHQRLQHDGKYSKQQAWTMATTCKTTVGKQQCLACMTGAAAALASSCPHVVPTNDIKPQCQALHSLLQDSQMTKLVVLWTVPATIKPVHMSMHLYGEDALMALVQNEVCGLVIATQQSLQRTSQVRAAVAACCCLSTRCPHHYCPAVVGDNTDGCCSEGKYMIRPRTKKTMHRKPSCHKSSGMLTVDIC